MWDISAFASLKKTPFFQMKKKKSDIAEIHAKKGEDELPAITGNYIMSNFPGILVFVTNSEVWLQ